MKWGAVPGSRKGLTSWDALCFFIRLCRVIVSLLGVFVES